MTTTWHVPEEALAVFANEPAVLDDVTASSIETHLVACEVCRVAVAGAIDPAALEASWAAVADAIDRPKPGPVERLLSRLVPATTARLVAATPGLQVAWLAAVVGVIAAAVAVSRSAGSPAPFLVFAPLVPLAGVAAAFWPGADPGGEAAGVAPLATAGLLLRRVQAVVAASLLVLAAGAVLLPDLDATAAGWLLPSLLVTLAALAGSTWLAPSVAITASATAWVLALALGTRGHRMAVAESALFAASGQLVMGILAALALAVVAARRRHFATVEVR